MAGWRENTSSETQDDLDTLLDGSLGLATQLLEETGEVYPFALVMTVDGETEMAASNAGAEKPVVAEVVESLTAGLISNRDQYRAVAVTARVRLTMNDGSPVNAVLVRLDHKEGPALDVYAPYTLKGRRRKVVSGDLKAVAGTRFVWEDKN